jgi:DNA-binding NarL/FixJ family response regulator
MNQGKVKLVIADDHTVLRQGLCEMLEDLGVFSVIGQAGDGEELLKMLETLKPDVILMDLSMPKLDGISTLDRLQSGKNEIPVVILTANEGDRSVRSAIKAGAKGYLPKNVGLEELEFAVNSVMSGQTYLSPAITAKLMNSGDPTASPLDGLTKREIEILKSLAQGKTNKVIGKLLHISSRTVDTHRSNIMKKLNLKTNAELARLAISEELIEV